MLGNLTEIGWCFGFAFAVIAGARSSKSEGSKGTYSRAAVKILLSAQLLVCLDNLKPGGSLVSTAAAAAAAAAARQDKTRQDKTRQDKTSSSSSSSSCPASREFVFPGDCTVLIHAHLRLHDAVSLHAACAVPAHRLEPTPGGWFCGCTARPSRPERSRLLDSDVHGR